jgi:cytochrome c-type biogenesis protein CcmH/NrfG
VKFSSISCPRFLAISLVFLLPWTAAHAQGPTRSLPRELHGQVERADGSPYRDGALVKVESVIGGLGAEVVTDSRGRFDVVSLEKSRYIVTVRAHGFGEARAEVDLDSVPRAYVQLTLHEATPTTPAAAPPKPPGDTVSVTDLTIPPAAQVEFQKGRILLVDKHKPADSVKPLVKAIQIAPNYSQAHFLLGTAYMDLAKWSDAESALNKAISFNDKLDSAYLALGSCLIEEKKFAEAEKPLLRGLEVFPDASQGHYDLGRAYFALNRFPEAEAHARRTLALEPDLPEAHLLLGNVLLRLRNGTDALEEFQEYLRLAPNGPFAVPAKALVKKLQAALPDTQ